MITADFHTHTKYCDGNNTPREMVLQAIADGMTAIGFSGHAYTSFDVEWCMTPQGTEDYIREIAGLKAEFGDKIRIYHGTEYDYYSDGPKDNMEYIIGSVHYVEKDGVRRSIDESPECLRAIVDEMFDGDPIACAESYYENVGNVVEKTGADIIGHFDLICKFNEVDHMFDTSDARYIAAWKKAADKLLETGKIFEINTGAISRGYRTKPYPATDIIDYIGKRGASFILSSDSHSTKTLRFGFDEWERYITERGYKLVRDLFES